VGSVFSPYYARALRRGGADPERHCAVNVALYGRGGHHWAMTERGASALARDSQSFSLGPSSLCWRGDALHIRIEERTMPFLGRISGEVTLRPGAVLEASHALDVEGRHVWRPIAPAARVEVAMTSPAQSWSGHGYLDANAGTRPIARDFRQWDWARASTMRGPLIHYDVTRRDGSRLELGLKGDRAGELQRVEQPPLAALRKTGWRIARNARSDPSASPRVSATLEDTPFYARSLVESRIHGENLTLMHESLDLDRLDTRWVETLLPFRMPRRG
jgi:carotenoid 1,2-hydratase